jgi:hypothetical protein
MVEKLKENKILMRMPEVKILLRINELLCWKDNIKMNLTETGLGSGWEVVWALLNTETNLLVP